MSQSTESRTDYVAGLRALADMLDANPDVPLPYGAGTGSWAKSVKLNWYLRSKDQMQAFVRAVPGPLTKEIEDQNSYGYSVHGSLYGLHFYASVDRDEVCERVVKGTREVTYEAPDPSAPPVPTVTVTATVEDVEWVCKPLLSEVSS